MKSKIEAIQHNGSCGATGVNTDINHHTHHDEIYWLLRDIQSMQCMFVFFFFGFFVGLSEASQFHFFCFFARIYKIVFILWYSVPSHIAFYSYYHYASTYYLASNAIPCWFLLFSVHYSAAFFFRLHLTLVHFHCDFLTFSFIALLYKVRCIIITV